MTKTKTRKDNKWRLDEQLRRLFIKKSFKEMISSYRDKLGIPKNGFTSNAELKKWLDNDLRKFCEMREVCVDIYKKFKLPFSHTYYIEAYLLMGGRYKQYNLELPWDIYSRGFERPDYLCAWEPDKGYECAVIKVFAGATAKDVKRFIDQRFREIKKFLNTFENRAVPTRLGDKLKRDRQILKLRKEGAINAIGCITIPVNKRDDILPEPIRKMGTDALRGVVKKERRMRR